jgi:hypothetical protein
LPRADSEFFLVPAAGRLLDLVAVPPHDYPFTVELLSLFSLSTPASLSAATCHGRATSKLHGHPFHGACPPNPQSPPIIPSRPTFPPPPALTIPPIPTSAPTLNLQSNLLDNQDLIRALEALQVASARAVLSSSTSAQDRSEVASGSKLLLMVVDPREDSRSIPESIARSDLTNLWRGRLVSLDEVTANLFLAAFCSEGDPMSIIRG